MKKSDMICSRADDSCNNHKSSPLEYNRIWHNKITEKYKIDHYDKINQLNKGTTRFANKRNNKDKLGKLNEKNSISFH